MTKREKSPLPQADYEAIEAAVMETARGRWFLAEYASRHRAADTAAILDAIARLETFVAARAETRRPAAATPPPPIGEATAPSPTMPVRAAKPPGEDIDWRGPSAFGASDVEKLEQALDAAWPADDEPAPIEDDVLFFVDPPESPVEATLVRTAASSRPAPEPGNPPVPKAASTHGTAATPGPTLAAKPAEPATYGDWGLRLDDPTLTMTRAQKLALFS